jgi:putative heme utilization carrier protein HutX
LADRSDAVSAVRARLAAEPGAILETVVKDYPITLREAVELLPEAMRCFAPARCFIEVMTEVAAWGDVTVVIHSDDGVMEFTGPLPSGSVARGYYNLAGTKGFHGHLRHEHCAGIAFVERPLFGRLSASILFSTWTVGRCSRSSSAATTSANCCKTSSSHSGSWRRE